MADTHRKLRNSKFAGWLVALGVLIFGIAGLAIWDYKIDHRPNSTIKVQSAG